MSRERCHSLDRAQRRQQQKHHYSDNFPERLPNRSLTYPVPQHALSAPEIYRRNYGGGGENRSIECIAGDDEELLADFEEPSFYDVPPNASFDELMCIMATPPPATQPTPTAAEKLDAFRAKIDEVIRLDLHKRMTADIETSVYQQSIAVPNAESAPKSPLCSYKIPPLPEDPHIIPPPPKDPKDVVAIIRRARAIARLKALVEAKGASKAQENASKKKIRGKTVIRKSMKQNQTLPKPKAGSAMKLLKKSAAQRPTAVPRKIARQPTAAQHPPDYVPDEWAAAILRTRKLAGLRTTNPNLLRKSKAPLPPLSTSLRCPPPPKSPEPPTFANVLERVAAIRARTNEVQTAVEDKKRRTTPQDELSEFEALEELYDAGKPNQYLPMEENFTYLQNRINTLQQQLLQTPPPVESISKEELDEFEALEQLYGAAPHDERRPASEYMATDLQHRINALHQTLFQSPIMTVSDKQSPVCELHSADLLRCRGALAAAAAKTGLKKESQRSETPILSPGATPKLTTPKRSRSPKVAPQIPRSKFDDDALQNINMPEFKISEIPGFGIRDELSLGDISTPDFYESISLDELGLEDITSPDLCNLSISDDGLALEPDYPLMMQENDGDEAVREEISKEPGFLTAVVNAVVDSFRNIFALSKADDGQNVEEETDLNFDSSLPNMFGTASPSKLKAPQAENPVEQKPLILKGPIIIPPHPKNPKDYMSMVKRAQAIQKKIAEESNMTQPSKEEMKSKKTPPPEKKIPIQKKKKVEKSKKVYPPGEYSPSDIKSVARARSLAGLKNLSALLNPERAARIAERKAAREAKLAAIEALPPVERMRKKMRSMRKRMEGSPRPSIECLATLEDIRTNLPKPIWRPSARLRTKHSVKPSERVFTQEQKVERQLDVMCPIAEESIFKDGDFIQFSPLKPHEAHMRLRYLREQAARRSAEAIKAEEERQTAITLSSQTDSNKTTETSTPQFSPIKLRSPSSPRTEKIRSKKTITKKGRHGGTETIREEVTETSTIENGEVHTSTKQVTTKTDEYGNVTCHVQEGKGLSGEEETSPEYLVNVEPPDFLDTSYIPPPRDPSIPTPAEIISSIRSKVKQKLNLALPDIPKSSRSPSPASPDMIGFPQDFTDENLYDIEAPEFGPTPQKATPNVKKVSPIEKDQRKYAWVELPSATPQSGVPTPAKHISPSSKPKLPERIIYIPPHPKDPKDYRAMVNRAQAIQKLKKQEDLAAMTARSNQLPAKGERVSISRRRKAQPKISNRNRLLLLKKRIPRVSPKNIEQKKIKDDKANECPSEPPPLSLEYREAVARARLMHGLKNRTAALNPEAAAKQAAEVAAQAVFDALPEVEKIKKRMEKVRKIPARTCRFEPSADILGTLAAIRANMPPLEEVLRKPSPSAQYLPVSTRATSPSPAADISLDEFEFIEKYTGAMPATSEVCVPDREANEDKLLKFRDISCLRPFISPDQGSCVSAQHATPASATVYLPSADPSLEEFENIEAELKSDLSLDESETPEVEAKLLYDNDIPKISKRLSGRQLTHEFLPQPRPRKTEPQSSALAPSMRILQQAGYFKDQGYDEMQDFRVPIENIVLETSQLMPETPPRNIQERYQRLKEAQKKHAILSQHSEQIDKTPTPTADFSPIRFISPSGTVYPMPREHKQQISPISLAEEGDYLVNIDGAPERKIPAVKQFEDLQDMPFDELEYEIEPSLTNISFEKPLSPPPRTSDIIRRIRYKVHQELRESGIANFSPTISPETIKMPDDLPDEELSKLTAPSFTKTPRTPQIKYKSPRVSLPMAWGEVQSVTPVSLPPPISTIIKETTPCPPQDIKEVIRIPESPIVIPPHPKNPKDYTAMIRRAKAIYKLNKQKEAEEVARARVEKTLKKGRLPNKISVKSKTKLALKKRVRKGLLQEKQENECPAEPPPLSQEYRDAIARARLLRGLKNRTAALNPKIAAKNAAKEAAAAAYNVLPEVEKLKVRMERLRRKPYRCRAIKPTMEQIAYLEALKQIGGYQTSATTPSPKSPTPFRISITPRSRQIIDRESSDFVKDESLAEFEAIEALEAPPDQCPARPATPLDMNKLISHLQQQQLQTPPRLDPVERYRQFMTQRKTPTIPIASPVKTPEIRYSPLTFFSSPSSEEPKKRAEKLTTQITRSGNNIIKEQVSEASEIVKGKLQHFTTHIATTTDPKGKVTCQIKESKLISARDSSAELEDLGDIQEPSFLDTTPVTPMDLPRPRDIIDRVRKQVKEFYRPEVPTGHLIELRTPPSILPLPKEVPEEELFDFSCPAFERTPSVSSVPSPTTSPVKTSDISIPELFQDTPPSSTPHHSTASPLSRRTPLSEGPTVISPYSKDPTDSKTRRARKIQQLIAKNTAEKRVDEKVEAKYAAEVAKSMIKGDPNFRLAATPPKKPGKRKKLVMKKRGGIMARKTLAKSSKFSEIKYPEEPPQLPEHYVKEVALSRILAGLKNRTAALNPKVAAREAVKAEIIRKAKEAEAAELAALNAPPRSPIKDYETVLSRMKEIKEKGSVLRGQPSLAAAAYLNALKGAAQVRQEQQSITESPKTRYKRILAAQVPYTIEESPIGTPSRVDIHYSPIRFISPRIGTIESIKQYKFDQAAFESLKELQNLSEFEQPSSMDVSEYQLNEDQYMPLTPPQTPPPLPSAIISRIRQQYEQQKATISTERPTSTPVALEFPKELPEEELVELSIPSFAQSPIKSETSIKSPNITIPRYFEESLLHSKEKTPTYISPRRSSSHTAAMIGEEINDRSDPSDVAARIRAQRIAKTDASFTRVLNYANIKERFAALKTAKKIQKGPTARELTHKQYLINRQQRQNRKRLLDELNQLRQQQGFEFEPIKTPPPARERLAAIKSRMVAKTPISSIYPYSPVRTPEVIDVPQYQPLVLPQTPPYQHLENVCIPNIEDLSIQLDDLDGHTMDLETTDEEDLEFQMTEAALAAYTKFDENINIAELEADNFDIAKRIEMLQHQLLESPNRANADVPDEYNMAKRIEMLQKQLLQTPTQQESSIQETNKVNDISDFIEDDEQCNQQNIYDELMDDFEAMERECCNL